MGLIFRNTFLKGRSMSQEKVKRDFGVGAQHHSPQLVLSHMLKGAVAVLALILKGLVDQRMVKEGLVLLYPGLHAVLRLQLLLYSDNRKGHGIDSQAVAFCDQEVMAGFPISPSIHTYCSAPLADQKEDFSSVTKTSPTRPESSQLSIPQDFLRWPSSMGPVPGSWAD